MKHESLSSNYCQVIPTSLNLIQINSSLEEKKMKHESLSSEDSKTQCDGVTVSNTEPESPIETENRKESTMKHAQKEKKKKAKAYPKKYPAQIFHVTWAGFVEQECEAVAHICQLCEEDLLLAPVDDNSYHYNDQIDYEPKKFPEVSVLACRHVFHKPCLDQATLEEQSSIDPTCFICLSLDS